MIDDHDRHALIAEHVDGIGQGAIAVAIEIGVRFVEHNQDGPAKKRAGQSDALALAAGKTGCPLQGRSGL
jgi:hypothetical protein